MQFFSWLHLRFSSNLLRYVPLKYLIMLLMALWVSVALPGCTLFQANLPTVLSPHPTQSVSQATASPQRFDGVTINIITHDAAIHTGVERNIAGFEALTGAKVNLTGVPVKNLSHPANQLVW
jgi:multiple sugar transport system substrate-binding protein